ncbi:MAG: hypothetical protein J2P25_10495 [Nocardiopsaceae bacterium]|nr:hypothetical protein [Nocardiopsaceae bacterium]
MPEPSRNQPPPSVVNAVRAMYAGLAASLVGIVVNVLLVSSLKSAIQQRYPHLTATQISSAEHLLFGASIASGLIGAALWWWMAQSCRAGKPWARTVSTVLFGIYTLAQVATAGTPSSGLSRIYGIVVWLIGLVAVVLLWQRPSTEFFREAGGLR